MKTLILTGPAACGKNTISQLLAKKRSKCAVIDVDLVRQMYRQPHKAPWEGEEEKKQQELGVKNAIILARNFEKNEVNVIILDVVTNETAIIYRKELPEAKIILLMPAFKEAQQRFKNRPHTISEAEFNLVYKWQESLTGYDEKIDNSKLSADATAEKINLLF